MYIKMCFQDITVVFGKDSTKYDIYVPSEKEKEFLSEGLNDDQLEKLNFIINK